ncbi:MAG: hypothetical protein ISEC1_P2065 [Thiomicrorhabdus sp.]|nr:MAG: hypothetical protein ISEC1_P2065 [Thiomicrorhabdus sp.]
MIDSFIDALLWIPRVLFSFFVDGLIVLFNLIPVPVFIADIDFSGFEPFHYFFDVFSIYWGLSLILSALVSRFIVRRLPVIG